MEVEERPVADLHQQRLARHDPDQLARAVLQLMEDHTMRILKTVWPGTSGSAEQ